MIWKGIWWISPKLYLMETRNEKGWEKVSFCGSPYREREREKEREREVFLWDYKYKTPQRVSSIAYKCCCRGRLCPGSGACLPVHHNNKKHTGQNIQFQWRASLSLLLLASAFNQALVLLIVQLHDKPCVLPAIYELQ